ncbi:hypothetical protein JCM18900_1886 [Psychrobacter sp. JCM 18900]|nr:hypothetical protein JCM18900_1886 [Psychrobacter sp. JCM 18900]
MLIEDNSESYINSINSINSYELSDLTKDSLQLFNQAIQAPVETDNDLVSFSEGS